MNAEVLRSNVLIASQTYQKCSDDVILV